MKKLEDLRKLNAKDLQKELVSAQKEVMKFRFESRTGQLAGAHKLRNAKKYVAQIKGVATENAAKEAQSK